MMDIDDSADKVRRNVVVFCSALIAFQFLHIDIGDITFFGVALNKMEPARSWVVVEIALLYLGLRYHFDIHTAMQREAATSLIHSVIVRRLQKLLGKAVEKHLKTLPCETPIPYAPDLDLSEIAERKDLSDTKVSALISDIDMVIKERAVFEASATFSIFFHKAADQRVYRRSALYSVPKGRLQWKMRLMAMLRASAYSKSSVDLFVPYALLAVAQGVCLSRLYLHTMPLL